VLCSIYIWCQSLHRWQLHETTHELGLLANLLSIYKDNQVI